MLAMRNVWVGRDCKYIYTFGRTVQLFGIVTILIVIASKFKWKA